MRRFGDGLLDALDQAFGQKPELYPWLTLPEVFDEPLELPAHVENASALLFGARRLLALLHAWLQARQQGALALRLRWQMDRRRNVAEYDHLLVRTAEPTGDMAHFERLLSEHLVRVTLAAPVIALRLATVETAPLPGASASLLVEDLRRGDSLHQLIERLSARLGAPQVMRVEPRADHRPERMQHWYPAIAPPPEQAGAMGSAVPGALAPPWLLRPPQPLALQGSRPCLHGRPLRLLAGPQRVEEGWWEAGGQAGTGEGLVRRDYFLAHNAAAGSVWIFRDRVSGAWFLQGVYG